MLCFQPSYASIDRLPLKGSISYNLEGENKLQGRIKCPDTPASYSLLTCISLDGCFLIKSHERNKTNWVKRDCNRNIWSEVVPHCACRRIIILSHTNHKVFSERSCFQVVKVLAFYFRVLVNYTYFSCLIFQAQCKTAVFRGYIRHVKAIRLTSSRFLNSWKY